MCVLISLVALAEETAAAAQKKIEETAATEFSVLKLHLAQMSNQIVPDGAILNMSPAGLLVSLSMLFNATEEDFLDHPLFRDMTDIDPLVYPDHIRHALVTSLYEQGVQFSPQIMQWLQPLSITGCRSYNVATLWGSNPEYVRAQDRCISLVFVSIKTAGFRCKRVPPMQAGCSFHATSRTPGHGGHSTGGFRRGQAEWNNHSERLVGRAV